MNFGKRVVSIVEFDKGSSKTRFQIWQAAIDAIEDRPVFGFGADTFRLVFPKYKPAEYVADAGYLSVADNVHNYPLQLAAGIGIPGMLMLYGDRRVGGDPFLADRVHEGRRPQPHGAGGVLGRVRGIRDAPVLRALRDRDELHAVDVDGRGSGTDGDVCRDRASQLGCGRSDGADCARGVRYRLPGSLHDGRQRLPEGAHRVPGRRRGSKPRKGRSSSIPYNDIYRAEVGLAYVDQLVEQPGSGVTRWRLRRRLRMRSRPSWARRSGCRTRSPSCRGSTTTTCSWRTSTTWAGRSTGRATTSEALEIAKQGVAVERFGPAIRLQYARALDATGDTDAAIKQLEYALRLDPRYSEATVLLALLYESQQRYGDAIRVLKASEAVFPGAPGVSDELRAARDQHHHESVAVEAAVRHR